MDEFQHEQRHFISPKDYVEIEAVWARKPRRRRLALILLAGVLCLFWSYTFLLGIVALLFGSIAFIVPHLLPLGQAMVYQDRPHLHQRLTYGVSQNKFWVVGTNFDLRCDWSNLNVWKERDDWFILYPYAMTPAYFSIAGLREAGVYDQVFALARKHGIEYGKDQKNAMV